MKWEKHAGSSLGWSTNFIWELPVASLDQVLNYPCASFSQDIFSTLRLDCKTGNKRESLSWTERRALSPLFLYSPCFICLMHSYNIWPQIQKEAWPFETHQNFVWTMKESMGGPENKPTQANSGSPSVLCLLLGLLLLLHFRSKASLSPLVTCWGILP